MGSSKDWCDQNARREELHRLLERGGSLSKEWTNRHIEVALTLTLTKFLQSAAFNLTKSARSVCAVVSLQGKLLGRPIPDINLITGVC